MPIFDIINSIIGGVFMGDNYVIEMRHITKVFPGIIANDDINLGLRKGEIHALLG